MMRLTLAAVGRLKAGAERDLLQRYVQRIAGAGKPVGLGPLTMHEIPESGRKTARERRREEGQALLAKRAGDACLICLDERGTALSSAAFAQFIASLRDRGTPEAVFALGGPDGHCESVRTQADRTIALGPMTLPHGLARVVLAEQLYRVLTILAGHPYHRG